jgi:phosphate transport system substrate-binding protein
MKTTYTIIIAIVAIAVIVGGVIAYMFLSQPNSTVKLNGAGATFPYPLLKAMITKYTTEVKTSVQINYQSIGSGGGVSALKSKTVDFGASDAQLSASDAANIPNALHIPETIGVATVAYNLPSISTGEVK